MTETISGNVTSLLCSGFFGIEGNNLAFFIIFIGIVIAVMLFLFVGWLQRKADTTHSKLDDILIAALGTPAILVVLIVSIYLALQAATLPPNLEWVLESKYFNAVYVILGAWVISSFAYNFIHVYGARLAGQTATDIDDRMIALGLIVVKYVVWFCAFLLILYILEIDITPLLAGAGIITLTVALAAQDIFSNFFGGALIAVDKPFKLNDRIQIDQYYGDIIQVGPRSTRMRTLDNQIVTIPNSKLVNNYVVNYAMPDTRLKVRLPIGVAYGSDVKKVKEILVGVVREMAAEHPFILEDPLPQVFFLEFGESSLNFQMLVWTNDFAMIFETKDAIYSRVLERFEEEGIVIPFPQVDVHMQK